MPMVSTVQELRVCGDSCHVWGVHGLYLTDTLASAS